MDALHLGIFAQGKFDDYYLILTTMHYLLRLAGIAAKAAPTAVAKEAAGGDAEGEGPVLIELNGRKRTATVGTFKGTVMVNIREYYEVGHLSQLLPLQWQPVPLLSTVHLVDGLPRYRPERACTSPPLALTQDIMRLK